MTDVEKSLPKLDVEKSTPKLMKSALLTAHSYLSPIKDQMRHACDFGIQRMATPEGDISTIWCDDATGIRTDRWGKDLPSRQELLRGFDVHDGADRTCFFESPLCLGLSTEVATAVIDRLRFAGAAFYVRNLVKAAGRSFGVTARLDLFWKQHRLQLKAAQMRVTRQNTRSRAA